MSPTPFRTHLEGLLVLIGYWRFSLRVYTFSDHDQITQGSIIAIADLASTSGKRALLL